MSRASSLVHWLGALLLLTFALSAGTAQAAGRERLSLISPAQAERPDPNQVLADNDMNSWGWGEPPVKQPPEALAWRAYRANQRLRADRNDGHGRLVFREITGQAEVWVDGVKIGEKTSSTPAPLTVPLAAGSGWRTLTVLVRSEPNQPTGVTGRVFTEPGSR